MAKLHVLFVAILFGETANKLQSLDFALRCSYLHKVN